MSPDQNNPQSSPDSIKDLINKNIHPEGARTFTAGLPEVAPHLITPETPEAIDPVTGNVSFDRLDPSLVEQATEPEIKLSTDTQTQPDQTELTPDGQEPVTSPSRWNRKNKVRAAIAGTVSTALLGGGLFALNQLTSDGEEKTRQRVEASAPAVPGAETAGEESGSGHGEQTNEALIDGLVKPSSKEQVQYVIDNPVSVEAFPDPVDAVVELGKHANVLFLANPDNFTSEEVEAMYASIYDVTSPYYQGSVTSMEQRRQVVAGQFGIHGSELEAFLALQPTTSSSTISPEGVAVNANIVYGGNVLNFMGANPDTTTDYNADFVLSSDGTAWHIYAANTNQEVGNIG